ncbi:MAG: HAD family phosphatase [Ignavibacteriae bacterium]|nr:HAD family phosphatase [Ignavibacteriota bacterium]MCB9244338.1 HAD family phosphatase [Ignavibacteriales bacterium]
MSRKEIKNIIFDLGNTLVFFDHNYFFSGIASYEKRFSTNAFRGYIVEHRLMEKLGSGHLTGKEFYKILKKEFKLTISYKRFVKIYRDIFWANKPMEKFLKKIIKSKKFNVYLLSNTDHLHIPYLYKIYPHIDLIKNKVISYRTGHIKPDKEIYEHIFEKYGIDPKESYFIDDMPDNIKIGKKLGLTTHLYTYHDDLEKEFKLLLKKS